jgi:hypothetical protein
MRLPRLSIKKLYVPVLILSLDIIYSSARYMSRRGGRRRARGARRGRRVRGGRGRKRRARGARRGRRVKGGRGERKEGIRH